VGGKADNRHMLMQANRIKVTFFEINAKRILYGRAVMNSSLSPRVGCRGVAKGDDSLFHGDILTGAISTGWG